MSGDADGRGVAMPAETGLGVSCLPRRSRKELSLPPLFSAGVTSGSSVQFGGGIGYCALPD